MQTELLDNFYSLLESHEDLNMSLAFEMAKGLQLDWGEEAYLQWWHLQQLNSVFYAQHHQEATPKKDEEELKEIIRAVHQIKRLKISAEHLALIPSTHAHRLIQLNYIEIVGLGDFRALAQSPYLRARTKEFRIIEQALKAFPAALKDFTNIEHLNLSKNKIQKLPDWIGNFSALKTLNLNFNQIAELPKELSQLQQIRSLWLAGNQLEELPLWLSELKRLRYLYIFDNPALSQANIDALRAVISVDCSIHSR